MCALDRILDHRLEFLGHRRIGEHMHQMFFVAEDEVLREHAGLRRNRRGIGGRGDDEVDVAGADLFKHDRLLAELRARELVDAHRALAQFHELGVEHVGGDAVGRRMRLVVAEGVFLDLGIGAGGHGKSHDAGGQMQRAQ